MCKNSSNTSNECNQRMWLRPGLLLLPQSSATMELSNSLLPHLMELLELPTLPPSTILVRSTLHLRSAILNSMDRWRAVLSLPNKGSNKKSRRMLNPGSIIWRRRELFLPLSNQAIGASSLRSSHWKCVSSSSVSLGCVFPTALLWRPRRSSLPRIHVFYGPHPHDLLPLLVILEFIALDTLELSLVEVDVVALWQACLSIAFPQTPSTVIHRVCRSIFFAPPCSAPILPNSRGLLTVPSSAPLSAATNSNPNYGPCLITATIWAIISTRMCRSVCGWSFLERKLSSISSGKWQC